MLPLHDVVESLFIILENMLGENGQSFVCLDLFLLGLTVPYPPSAPSQVRFAASAKAHNVVRVRKVKVIMGMHMHTWIHIHIHMHEHVWKHL